MRKKIMINTIKLTAQQFIEKYKDIDENEEKGITQEEFTEGIKFLVDCGVPEVDMANLVKVSLASVKRWSAGRTRPLHGVTRFGILVRLVIKFEKVLLK